MAFVGMKHLSSFIALLSVLNVMVFSVERLPVNVVYDTKTGKYYAIMETDHRRATNIRLNMTPRPKRFGIIRGILVDARNSRSQFRKTTN